MQEKVQFFSDKTNKLYQLYPTKTIPTLRISGVPMHRFATIDPKTDTELKIRALRPYGNVLDCCTGLGYTAIFCAKERGVDKVTTTEKDSEVIKIAKMNSASNELFENKKIKMVNADINVEIKKFRDGEFDCIMHDPPTYVMAYELYHNDFHKELYRVLKKEGRLWHYSPMPGKAKSEEKGMRLTNKIIGSLRRAGFKNIKLDSNSVGVIAIK